MGIGKRFASEMSAATDPDTGARVSQLTNYRGNSNHLYFTNNGWYDEGRRLVFASDRDNRSNLFSIELDSGEITQLTDLADLRPPEDYKLLEAVVDPIRNRCYFFARRELICIDLMTLAQKVLYTIPEGFCHHVVSCCAGAKHVFTSIYEDFSSRFHIDTQHGYVGFDKIREMNPLSRLLMIDADTGRCDCLLEENQWIAHVNVSPTNEGILTYCHEGSWKRVDHRIWGMDVASCRTWKIHPCAGGEAVGHEYWLQDGVHIGYHGSDADGGFFGCVSFDNREDRKTSFGGSTGHTFALTADLIVGDGGREGKYIRLWPLTGGNYASPRALCGHLSSFKSQNDHAHPRISPDGRHVLFTSDRAGYGNLYLAEIPPLGQLPLLSSLI